MLGQPEFRATLQHEPSLEQLRQRIIAAHHLEAMKPEEIEPYLIHRLQKVGWDGNPSFDEGVFAELYKASGGIPRKVNQLTNRLLLLGAIEQRSQIDTQMLELVVAEMQSESAYSAVAPEPVATEAAFAQPVAAAGAAEEGEHKAEQIAIDPQLIDDLLAERDIQIAELREAVSQLASREEVPDADAVQAAKVAEAAQAAMREQIGELQQAIVELSSQQDQAAANALGPDIAALRGPVLVTGASGFVGANLFHLLSRKRTDILKLCELV